MTTPIKTVPVSTVLHEILGNRPHGEETLKLIKQYGITVITTFNNGRGEIYLMSQDQADSLIKVHGTAKERKSRPVETPATGAELHIEVLEKKVSELTTVVNGLTDGINILTKQNNILCDKLNQVLLDLGHGPKVANGGQQ